MIDIFSPDLFHAAIFADVRRAIIMPLPLLIVPFYYCLPRFCHAKDACCAMLSPRHL